jgi:hypothetical protein
MIYEAYERWRSAMVHIRRSWIMNDGEDDVQDKSERHSAGAGVDNHGLIFCDANKGCMWRNSFNEGDESIASLLTTL